MTKRLVRSLPQREALRVVAQQLREVTDGGPVYGFPMRQRLRRWHERAHARWHVRLAWSTRHRAQEGA